MKSLPAKLFAAIITALLLITTSACENPSKSFSLLPEYNNFNQSATYAPRKIDILWVIDNSNSMETSQNSLVTNFSSFINKFKSLNYDFHMAITTTDAYIGKFRGGNDESFYRRLRNWGARPKDPVKHTCQANRTDVTVMDRDTANLSEIFLVNAGQSTCGSGDERALASMEDVLSYTENNDFRRSDAFLAIIIVSDEDDFSSTTLDYLKNDYNDSRLISSSHYKSFLDDYAGPNNYTVNAITILDDQCLETLNNQFNGRRIGKRHIELSDLSGGVKASICSDFGVSLQLISDSIVQLISSFKLTREPNESTFRIFINGESIANDSSNGWTYDAATLTITFHGSSIPREGANVSIEYDPLKPK